MIKPCNPNAKLETKCLHAGYTPENGGPGVMPIVQSTTYRFDSTEHVADLFDMPMEPMYSRFANPTCDAVEQKIAALEGGVGAMLTTSGQAASLLSILNVCSAGDSFLAATTIYGGTVNLFGVTLKKLGIECIWVHADASEEEMFFAIDAHSNVILGDIAAAKREKVLNYCFENNRRIYILPTVQDIMLNSAAVTQIGDTMALLCRNRPMTMEQMAIKRLADILISAIALIVLSPVLAIVALLIKLYDGGPVLFRQDRYTRNNEIFTLVKFRSMIVDAEKDGAQFTVPGDKRITPIGKFIRATRIDELPQLINVLKGDMSIVGPRAERLENADAYTEMMPEFRYRTKVKAGLTGYAQVYGKYNTSFEDKVRMDLYYIENYSLFMDFKLLLYTIKVIFMKESTEGFENETLKEEFRQDEK